MCDSIVLDLIRAVVAQKMANKELFTAYDVSKVVQAEESAKGLPFTRHAEIRGDVRSVLLAEMQVNNYTCVIVPIASPPPFLYYPIGADPNTYIPFGQTQPIGATAWLTGYVRTLQQSPDVQLDGMIQPPPSALDAPAPQKALLASQDTSQQVGRKADDRGCVCVPAPMLREAGFAVGNTAYAAIENRHNKPVLVLSKDVANSFTSYTVDPSGNVRVTAFALQQAAILGPEYDFIRQGAQVIIW